ncbi:conserved protein of unknown function [Ectopseudomonas oleovorans]|uniref:Uncharacterized protein n=1 Tax=Ectopseudomonas oleovorans TaxID=301 RepID=A0A653B477_ECTOL|nr:conserved protein of unknown function [Pseudomonas oleovorans]
MFSLPRVATALEYRLCFLIYLIFKDYFLIYSGKSTPAAGQN